MNKPEPKFLDSFPGHQYRYIDQTGGARPPITSLTKRDDLNLVGYEAYFTVNGFANQPDCKKEQCTSLNALFVDIDGRKDKEELEVIKKKLDPTFILETGNGHHIYWCLDEVIYRDEVTPEAWEEAITKWEILIKAMIADLNSDPKPCDVPRIMRQPDTYYWKKSGDAYTKGTDGVFKIKGVYKNLASTYSMDRIAEAFPIKEAEVTNYATPNNDQLKKFAEQEKKDFFKRVNEKYPIADRPSFKKLVSGEAGTLPPNIASRNEALLITATLMRQAGWSKADAVDHIKKVGWHGIEKERGGLPEILSTINSAYASGYTYSYKNEVIAWNMNDDEQSKIQLAYAGVQKDRLLIDRARFANYEYELSTRYPHLRKNEIGIVFNYNHGVYRMVSDLELSSMVLTSLYDDMLWGYRTKRNVSDKVACLLSIIPNLELTPDRGCILNCKNGLLDIFTRKLIPHSPDFVSLIQSPMSYDPEAQCPIWLQCMDAWMEGEEKAEKTLLLQQFAGYCLSSSMQYDRALFLIGDGGNGKSTFVDTISMVVGKEATSHIDLESLYSTFGMAGLIGMRLNVIEEVHNNYYQSNKLKKLISGEKVTIDIKYKPQFSFRPQAKFIFAVNQMPRVDDTSTATERRICAVQFLNNFRENPNVNLRSDMGLLYKELSGILNWMLEGTRSLFDMGNFIKTQEQTKLLSDYRQENSSVEGFIGDCLEFEETKVSSVRDLYDEYKKYCTADGRKFKGNRGFTNEMKAYGTRYKKFKFVERSYGGDVSKFEGVGIDPSWNKQDYGPW